MRRQRHLLRRSPTRPRRVPDSAGGIRWNLAMSIPVQKGGSCHNRGNRRGRRRAVPLSPFAARPRCRGRPSRSQSPKLQGEISPVGRVRRGASGSRWYCHVGPEESGRGWGDDSRATSSPPQRDQGPDAVSVTAHVPNQDRHRRVAGAPAGLGRSRAGHTLLSSASGASSASACRVQDGITAPGPPNRDVGW